MTGFLFMAIVCLGFIVWHNGELSKKIAKLTAQGLKEHEERIAKLEKQLKEKQ